VNFVESASRADTPDCSQSRRGCGAIVPIVVVGVRHNVITAAAPWNRGSLGHIDDFNHVHVLSSTISILTPRKYGVHSGLPRKMTWISKSTTFFGLVLLAHA
jgi:hypothetical protein